MSENQNIFHIPSWTFYQYRVLIHGRRYLKQFLLKSILLSFLLLSIHTCFTRVFLPSNPNDNDIALNPPFHDLIPSNRFHLFWTLWITDQSTFRGRRLLALESIFIHHPNATVIMLSPTLNDTTLFLPFRLRGYRIVLEEDSHLDLLLELIYTHQHIDIIAGKIPEDINIFHDYSGVFLRYNQTLELIHSIPNGHGDRAFFPRPSNRKVNEKNPCRQVDFVPNVFMGRRESVLLVAWDNDLKLGEHEDFFLRFGEANRTVYTCQHIHVRRSQISRLKKVNAAHNVKGTRAAEYLKQILKNRNLKRLIVFGYVQLDLDEKFPESKYLSRI